MNDSHPNKEDQPKDGTNNQPFNFEIFPRLFKKQYNDIYIYLSLTLAPYSNVGETRKENDSFAWGRDNRTLPLTTESYFVIFHMAENWLCSSSVFLSSSHSSSGHLFILIHPPSIKHSRLSINHRSSGDCKAAVAAVRWSTPYILAAIVDRAHIQRRCWSGIFRLAFIQTNEWAECVCVRMQHASRQYA